MEARGEQIMSNHWPSPEAVVDLADRRIPALSRFENASRSNGRRTLDLGGKYLNHAFLPSRWLATREAKQSIADRDALLSHRRPNPSQPEVPWVASGGPFTQTAVLALFQSPSRRSLPMEDSTHPYGCRLSHWTFSREAKLAKTCSHRDSGVSVGYLCTSVQTQPRCYYLGTPFRTWCSVEDLSARQAWGALCVLGFQKPQNEGNDSTMSDLCERSSKTSHGLGTTYQ
jgi:hypothetical protein